jgi:hypothetical protein
MPSNLLLKLPAELMTRFKSVVPARQRTRVIATLVELEVQRREQEIECVAAAVEADGALNDDMRNWDATIADGIDEYVAEHDEAR